MKKELEKTYDPKQIEDKIYHNWTEKGYFHAEVNPNKKPFTIVMPPPKYHRTASHGTCLRQYHAGHPHPF